MHKLLIMQFMGTSGLSSFHYCQRAINWLKFLTNRNAVMTRIFQSQIDAIESRAHARPSRYRHKRFWAKGIKSLLDELGFSYTWLNQDLQISSYEMIRN